MNRKLIPAILGLAVLLALAGCDGCVLFRFHSAACRQRGAAYTARVEKLKKDARESLKIGTSKQEVIRFFKENGLPVEFVKVPYERSGTVYEAIGTIRTTGCAPSGCGTDDAILGLRVNVDKTGRVISEPVVGALYTNCL